jgi:hypothetical protein
MLVPRLRPWVHCIYDLCSDRNSHSQNSQKATCQMIPKVNQVASRNYPPMRLAWSDDTLCLLLLPTLFLWQHHSRMTSPDHRCASTSKKKRSESTDPSDARPPVEWVVAARNAREGPDVGRASNPHSNILQQQTMPQATSCGHPANSPKTSRSWGGPGTRVRVW